MAKGDAPTANAHRRPTNTSPAAILCAGSSSPRHPAPPATRALRPPRRRALCWRAASGLATSPTRPPFRRPTAAPAPRRPIAPPSSVRAAPPAATAGGVGGMKRPDTGRGAGAASTRGFGGPWAPPTSWSGAGERRAERDPRRMPATPSASRPAGLLLMCPWASIKPDRSHGAERRRYRPGGRERLSKGVQRAAEARSKAFRNALPRRVSSPRSQRPAPGEALGRATGRAETVPADQAPAGRAPGRVQATALTSTLRSFCLASALFGRVTVSTPLAKDAVTASASMSGGRGSVRWTAP